MTERIFYDDAQMRYLLKQQPVRYTNVYINMFGDQFYGSSHKMNVRVGADLSGRKPVYRIIVKAKPAKPKA